MINNDLFATSDDDFFGNLQSSNLQHLFKDSGLSKDEKEQSLKYERPKATDLKGQHKSETTSAATSSNTGNNMSSSTLMAKVVTVYKQGELQGKVGLALIKNNDESFNLLVYKSKTQILATLRLGHVNDKEPAMLFKQHQFWQFYDQDNIYWSWRFELQKDEDDFRDLLVKHGQNFKESEDLQDSKVVEQKPEDNIPNLDVIKEPKKNALIERMAKMGQPLPKLAPKYSENSDSSGSSNSSPSPVVIRRSFPPKYTSANKTDELATVKTPQPVVTSTVALNSSIFPVNAMESQYMQMLLTEQRTQGSELRMNMSKLETKIEKVLDKIDLIERAGGTESSEKRHRDDEILELEEKILLLKKENRKLKQFIEQGNEHKDTFALKSKEILSEYKDELSDLNMEHIKDLKTLLKCCIEKIQDNKADIRKIKEKKIEEEKTSQEKLKELETLNSSFGQQLKESKEQQLEILKSVEEKEKIIKDCEKQIQEMNEQLKKKTDEKAPPLDPIVKSVMNNLYADICEKLQYIPCENSNQILALIATSIKQQTLKTLQQQTQNN